MKLSEPLNERGGEFAREKAVMLTSKCQMDN